VCRWFDSNLLHKNNQVKYCLLQHHFIDAAIQLSGHLKIKMMNKLLQVSLRQQAVFIPDTAIRDNNLLTTSTSLLIANLAKLGFGVTEPLLQALNATSPSFQLQLLESFREIMKVKKNWTPLVKGWNVPTDETVMDHIITFFANAFKSKGTTLPCGHIIPANTFPLERYNGCPFCGTPFEFGDIEYHKQGSEIKILDLWTLEDATVFLHDLLTAKTALDATQMDGLKMLLTELPVPSVLITMKETLMAVIDSHVARNNPGDALALFTSPTDVLRYLWYKHTGFLQPVTPNTIITRQTNNQKHIGIMKGNTAQARLAAKERLKLKYSRKDCLMVAGWLNHLNMEVVEMCEAMHAKRGMWVRFIRALRLPEYSKRKGFERLHHLLDVFYNGEYEMLQSRVDHYRLRMDAANTFLLLKQRPGLFARSLFANMLWFGVEDTMTEFATIIDKVPARLLFTLNAYAASYFDKKGMRMVKPLGGVNKKISVNKLVKLYEQEDLMAMQEAVSDICILAMKNRFSAMANQHRTMFIDPALFKIPVAIGDRSDTVQDLPAALMGTRFSIAGETVRLFMQWGVGLPAQHLDMDLSCEVIYAKRNELCSFSQLHINGCRHSGDIRSIPDEIGTAEYIDIDLGVLRKLGARYVVFTCNAYSNGSIVPNLVVGWMNSKFPMKISEKTGVAYDPSCVQHQVRIVNNVSKGLMFGMLDVAQAELIWLEIPFAGQLAQHFNIDTATLFLKKLEHKLTIGQLLKVKAAAQQLELVDTEDADEVYTMKWALNTAAVTKLLID
jgi:hypothetical protein